MTSSINPVRARCARSHVRPTTPLPGGLRSSRKPQNVRSISGFASIEFAICCASGPDPTIRTLRPDGAPWPPCRIFFRGKYSHSLTRRKPVNHSTTRDRGVPVGQLTGITVSECETRKCACISRWGFFFSPVRYVPGIRRAAHPASSASCPGLSEGDGTLLNSNSRHYRLEAAINEFRHRKLSFTQNCSKYAAMCRFHRFFNGACRRFAGPVRRQYQDNTIA